MRHVAVVGSGPAGYYTAEALTKQFGKDAVQIDVIDCLPTPYGLIRAGVAPDHQSIKAVYKRYEGTSLAGNVRFVGNVLVGRDISIDELLEHYNAVVLATGAPHDRPLGVEGDQLAGVIGSASFVGWYNGHPEFVGLAPPLAIDTAVVVGVGNVALDVARILAKTPAEFGGSDIVGHALDALEKHTLKRIVILGRRGPHQIQMTPKELGELGHLRRAAPLVDPADLPPQGEDAALDPGQRKSVTLIRDFAGNPRDAEVLIDFDFFARPVRVEGNGHVEQVVVERTALNEKGGAVGTGEFYTVPCGMVVSCIGYRTPTLAGVPYDEGLGRFANDDGRIAMPHGRLYCVGWAKRGPTGTIGTNRPDGFLIAEEIAADDPTPEDREGGAALDRLLAERGIRVVNFSDWQNIEAAEIARARAGSPREKFVAIEDMLAAIQP
jgi:ferredoxin--NADP+ reductase